MADCDRELQRVEQRIDNAEMAPENERQLQEWLDSQRQRFDQATDEQCVTMAAQIERQLVEHGYVNATSYTSTATAAASTPRTHEVSDPDAGDADVRMQPTEVEVDAPATRIAVDQPAAQVDVRQKPADVEIEMQQAEVTVQVPEPRVKVTQPPPQVHVNQPDPKVQVNQEKPQVSVHQPEPNVRVQQAEPKVQVQQSEAQVTVQQSDGAAWEREPAAQQGELAREESQWRRTDAAATRGELQQVQASELVGDQVVDERGQFLGSVREALKKPGTNEIFVRIDVLPTHELGANELVLSTSELERNADNLLLRGSEQELRQSASQSPKNLEPAGDVTVQLASSE